MIEDIFEFVYVNDLGVIYYDYKKLGESLVKAQYIEPPEFLMSMYIISE